MSFDTILCRVVLSLVFFLSLFPSASASEHAHDNQLTQFIKHAEKLSSVPLINRRKILAKTRVFDVQLSPDGQFLSYRQAEGDEDNNRSSIWLYDIKQATTKKLFTYKALNALYWAHNSRALFLKTRNGIAVSRIFENPSPILLVKLTHQEKERWLGSARGYDDSFMVRLWDAHADEFVITRIDVKGNKTQVYRTKQDFSQVLFNRKGEVAFLKVTNNLPNNKGEKFVYAVKHNSKQLDKVWACRWDDPCSLRWYDDKNQRLLLRTNTQSNFEHFAWFDLKTKAFNALHQDPEKFADVAFGNLVFNAKKSELILATASYYGDYMRTYGINAQIQQHIAFIESQLGEYNLNLHLPERVDTELLFSKQTNWFITIRKPTSAIRKYYIYSPATETLTQPLADIIDTANLAQPMMTDDIISPKSPIRYQARDGFNLQGYLTLPRGVNIKQAPLVVYPHGGPWSRDYANYNALEQLLANRGYIVFKPNFRASTGFGKAYKMGTNNDFGNGTTQNDIIDGVHFLLNNGVGDKDKLAIVGHSFGGFSTLAGLTFTPNLFKVGVAGAPPSFMGRSAKFYHRFQKKTQRESREYAMKALVVDWDDPKAFAKSYEKSPDKHIENINVPLIMWAGQKDRRVFIVDVKDYTLRADELKKRVSLFVDPKAFHSPNSEIGTLAYAYLIEKSLATYLGGKLMPIDKQIDKALYRFIDKNLVIDHNDLI